MPWLERLIYGAESCRKVVSLKLGCTIWQLENSLCQPRSEWVTFSNQGRVRQQKERDGLCLSSAVHKIRWDLNPTVPTAVSYGKPLPSPLCNGTVFMVGKISASSRAQIWNCQISRQALNLLSYLCLSLIWSSESNIITLTVLKMAPFFFFFFWHLWESLA